MEGGATPIRDGDWLVMRFARDQSLGALSGKIALLQVPDQALGYAYQIKRIVPVEGGRWQLRSENPTSPSFEASAETVPIAALQEVIPPEALAPSVGTQINEEDLTSAFHLSSPPHTGRTEGHLFLRIEVPGAFVEPDRLKWPVADRRPGETAFVLARAGAQDPWRYCGVAHWREDEQLWALPDLDYTTWRALGKGRASSRRLPPGALEQARQRVDALLEESGPGGWLEQDGKRFRVVGRSPEGGVRIEGGSGGFKERTVSLTDLAWVLLTQQDAEEEGGLVDEARVNRLRYLEGTPKAATRWIDTGWALRLLSSKRTHH